MGKTIQCTPQQLLRALTLLWTGSDQSKQEALERGIELLEDFPSLVGDPDRSQLSSEFIEAVQAYKLLSRSSPKEKLN